MSICAVGWLSGTEYVLELNEIVPGKRAPREDHVDVVQVEVGERGRGVLGLQTYP